MTFVLGLILAAEKFWSLVKRQKQLSHFRRLVDQTLEPETAQNRCL
ncbi:hypothetical protein AB3R30_20025 [Leptolyngbyaceae cyanobacterium UHCC 1019]